MRRQANAPSATCWTMPERRIFNISMKKSEDTLVHIEKTAMDTYFHIGELMALKGKLSGITTGFTDLDKLTSGLQRSDLIIVAGRPSMGKTAFALNVAQNAALKGATICIFSLEMSREQLVRRMLCANAGVDMQRVNTGNTTDADLIELSTALADLSATNIYIDDTAGVFRCGDPQPLPQTKIARRAGSHRDRLFAAHENRRQFR